MRGVRTGQTRVVQLLSVQSRSGRVRLSIHWDAHHLWLGAYWDLRSDDRHNGYLWHRERTLSIWICLLPTVPLCVSIPWPGKEHGRAA